MTSSQMPATPLFETDPLDDSFPYPLRLWQVGLPVSTIPTETIVIVHGRQSDFDDSSDRPPLSELYPRLYGLSIALAQSPSAQVLFLDGQEALTDPSLPPYDAAGRIRLMADWAVAALQGVSNLTVVGHSLGSYVAAEVAAQLNADRLIALDPAFPAQNYDVDESEPGQQSVRNFGESAPQSLSFVVADGLFQLGLAGDNQQSATAKTSLVAKFDGLGGIFDADEAHGAVVDLYADLSLYLSPSAATFDALWQDLAPDRYDHSGDRRTGLHEGVAYADRDAADIWRLEWIDSDGHNIYFVGEQNEPSESLDLAPDEHSTVVTLRDYNLDENAHDLVLGGYAPLRGTGNAAANTIWGNASDNHLFGLGGDDILQGNWGDDTLGGDAGVDRLEGNQNDDWLMGGGGDDVLLGGAKHDVLLGDRGFDILEGGFGADVFVLQLAQGVDQIVDFKVTVDRLYLDQGIELQQLELVQQQNGTLIRHGNEDLVEVLDVAVADLTPEVFIA